MLLKFDFQNANSRKCQKKNLIFYDCFLDVTIHVLSCLQGGTVLMRQYCQIQAHVPIVLRGPRKQV